MEPAASAFARGVAQPVFGSKKAGQQPCGLCTQLTDARASASSAARDLLACAPRAKAGGAPASGGACALQHLGVRQTKTCSLPGWPCRG